MRWKVSVLWLVRRGFTAWNWKWRQTTSRRLVVQSCYETTANSTVISQSSISQWPRCTQHSRSSSEALTWDSFNKYMVQQQRTPRDQFTKVRKWFCHCVCIRVKIIKESNNSIIITQSTTLHFAQHNAQSTMTAQKNTAVCVCVKRQQMTFRRNLKTSDGRKITAVASQRRCDIAWLWRCL